MDVASIMASADGTGLLRLVDVVLAANLIELLWILGRRPTRLGDLLPNLLAGTSLALALRLGLAGAGAAWVAPCLAAAGVSHALDLRARLRRPTTSSSTSTAASGLERLSS